jgi:peptide/nickel transport system substrate-binding protein
MIRTLRLLLLGLLAASLLAVAACGDDDDGNAGGGNTVAASEGADDNAKALAVEGKRGGRLMQLASSDVDYLDPGQTYYQFGYQTQYAISRFLYNYKPTSPDVVPDIADGEPEISDDQKTVTVKLKDGIKYSPPLDREIAAADIKYAFERGFSKQVNNQYRFYYDALEGYPEELTDGAKDVSGITTPDEKTIVFKLTKPVGAFFANALVMPITAPVPEEYAKKFDSKNPSTYNTNVVATGPYMVRNNAKGELTGYKAGKSISLVRNPNWDAKTDFRPAYLDEIFTRTNASDASVAAKQVLAGKSMILDTNPPVNVLREVVTERKAQYMQVPAGGTRYLSLNTEIKPLDDVNVRKAIIAGVDRSALRKARGGAFIGDIPRHFIPLGVPGFEESGGAEGFGDEFDFMSSDTAQPEVAEKYMKAAGFASGKYEGDEELLMIGANADPNKAVAEVARGELQRLGFKVRLRLVPQDSVYTDWCQVPDKKVAICASAGWFKDFSDAQTVIQPIFDGKAINRQGGNNNLALLDDPAANKAIAAAVLESENRPQAWADANKAVVAQAPLVPYVADKTTLIRSENVNGVADDNASSLWDLTFTSLR